MIRLALTALAVALVTGQASACSRCGNYVHCAYAQPSYTYTYPYTDNRFQVTYNIALPAAAASGSTLYQYTPLDYNEQLRLAYNYASRSQDAGQYAIQQATTTFQLGGAAENTAAEARTIQEFRKLAEVLKSSSAVTLTVQKDAHGNLSWTAPGPKPLTGNFLDRIGGHVRTSCVRCHQAGGEHAEFDLSDLSKLSNDAWDKVFQKVVIEETMPKGGQLSAEAKLDFTKAWAATLQPAAGSAAPKTLPKAPAANLKPMP